MKNLFILLLGVFSLSVHAIEYSKLIDTSSTNLGTSFDKTSSASMWNHGVRDANGIELEIVNRSSTRIAYNFRAGDSANNPTIVDGYVEASGYKVITSKEVSPVIYLKSTNGTISSGVITIEARRVK